jgi:hypothetical protein
MKLWLNVAEGAEYAGVCRDLIYDACADECITSAWAGVVPSA